MEYTTKKSSDRSILLCVLRTELLCVFGDFYVSGTQDAVTKSLNDARFFFLGPS